MSRTSVRLLRPRPTGGSVVFFKPGLDQATRERVLANLAGSEIRSFAATGALPSETRDLAGMLLEKTRIGFLSERFETDEAETLRARLREDDHVLSVRPEYYYRALESFDDDDDRTWGIDAVGAWTSPLTGAGIKVAILDTGLDLNHPDFAGRTIVAESFVSGEDVQDGQGHGTHCAGTAAGSVVSEDGMRYGVATGADIYVGKVLNNRGSGRERDILTGMAWAIDQGCEVISMSLGAAVQEGETYAPEYEDLARQALEEGSLIVAAAGNESTRTTGYVAPVGSPANCPSIMAVAAVDQTLNVAEFSSGGINPDGGEVNIAGPGVGVLSAAPEPELYATYSGTSMACPHVAGIAALMAGDDTRLRGQALWDRLVSTARSLDGSPQDVGAGLVQAPGQAGSGMV
ncbi:S8 family peptidase [Aestuariibius sp. 2305UL40-4]|uniref:S8 family peptidase n=1 Tax=Aestuariibius violaceus TaxID=3234132 RepID=UPI00345E683C